MVRCSKGFVKRVKMVASIILAILMTVVSIGFGSIYSRAEGTGDSSENNYGLHNPRVAYNYRDTVTFGHYWQEDTNGDGKADENDDKQPIVWQVLERYDDGTALVLSDKVLDKRAYYIGKDKGGGNIDYSCTWDSSDIKKWLNEEFKNKAFSSTEQNALRKSQISSGDYVFLLSVADATNSKYEFNEDEKNSDQARNPDFSAYAQRIISGNIDSSTYWWLMSSGNSNDRAPLVHFHSTIKTAGEKVNEVYGIRPALRVDLNSSYVSSGKTVKISEKGLLCDSIILGKYNGNAIQWRVLRVSGNDAFLLSEKVITTRAYNEENKSMTWKESTLRKWLNNEFYNASFSEAEKKSIKTTKVLNENNTFYGTSGGDYTEDKIYLLSLEDTVNPAYGFSDKYLVLSNMKIAYDYVGNVHRWWIRTPGFSSDYGVCVDEIGISNYYGDPVDFVNGIRPCLHVDLSSSIWKKGESIQLGDPAGGEVIPLSDKNKTDIPIDNTNNKTTENTSSNSSDSGGNNGNIKKNQTISKVNNLTKTYATKKFSLGAVTNGNGKLSYSSSNKKVAIISADGKVTLIGAGKTKITIKASGTSTYNPAEKTITLTVNKAKQKITSKVKTKTITYTSTPFSLGTKVQGNAKVTYKSSNPKVLTVSNKGKVTLKGIGKATITIKTKQNAKFAAGTKKIVITVKPPKVKLLKCTALSDCRVKLSWTGAQVFDGYEIQFSQDSKFSEGYEPIDYKKKSSSTILRGGAEGRTYYVRIRPYRRVNGKKITYAWSNVNSFKTFK